MGFRSNTYATVWEVQPISDTMTKGRISINRKNKQTGEYEQDFSGYVKFVGTAVAKRALNLQPKDRIKIGDVDVSNRYDKEKRVEYTDFKIFSFEEQDGAGAVQSSSMSVVDDGEVDNPDLPY